MSNGNFGSRGEPPKVDHVPKRGTTPARGTPGQSEVNTIFHRAPSGSQEVVGGRFDFLSLRWSAKLVSG